MHHNTKGESPGVATVETASERL